VRGLYGRAHRLGSRLNLVERWFAELTNRKLRRYAHRSVTKLETDIRKWITEWNKDPGRSSGPNPPVWTAWLPA
jgi:transposase